MFTIQLQSHPFINRSVDVRIPGRLQEVAGRISAIMAHEFLEKAMVQK